MAAVKEEIKKPSRAEEELGNKWDQCLTDSSIKIGGGLVLGGLFSLILFKRRPWPIIFGFGVGLGKSYADCDNLFKNKDFISGKIKKAPARERYVDEKKNNLKIDKIKELAQKIENKAS